LKYDKLLEAVAEQAGKKEEFNEIKYKQVVRKNKVERNFGEIASNEDFEARCLSYNKGCAIGLLSANTLIDYET
jgi:hypothetical protein